MKGLLRKDLYMMWKYCRLLLGICVIFLAISVLGGEDNLFFLVYPVLLGGVLPVTLMSYDERFGWNRYCDALPISRRTVVNERYALGFLSFAALYLLTLAAQAAVQLPRGQGAMLGQIALLLPGIGLLPSAILLPIVFRWGVEKGRLVYYALIGAFVAAGLILADGVMGRETPYPIGGGAALAVLCLVLYGASWLLSTRWYETREL